MAIATIIMTPVMMMMVTTILPNPHDGIDDYGKPSNAA